MTTETDSKDEIKVFHFEEDSWPAKNKVDEDFKTNDLQNDVENDEIISKDNADLNEHIGISRSPNYTITIWRNRKLYANKCLIPLRVAQFLWYGSGSLFSPFFSSMLTHRGLNLTEISSVFFVIFPLQITLSYSCGVIVDKLGNAKPVLLFLMLGVVTAVIGLLLSPNVIDKSCLETDVNMTCISTLNYTLNLESCKHPCYSNSSDNSEIQDGNIYSKDSTKSLIGIDMNNASILEGATYLNNSVLFCIKICSCFEKLAKNCSSTYTANIGLKTLYLSLILCFWIFWNIAVPVLDFTSLTVAKQHNSDFGNERMYGVFGALTATLLCNFVLNIDTSVTKEYYDNIYWFAVFLYVLSVISVFCIREVVLPPGLNLTKKTFQLFTDTETVSVVLVAFVAGSAFSFNIFYHVWFLDTLKASKRIIGFHTVTSPLYGLPIYVTSKWWLRTLGRKKITFIGLLCYAVSGICYSFLYYPWLSLIIEITKAFSFHLYWTATVIHCGEIAQKGFAATVTSLVGTAHFGVGRSFSIPVGGYLISTFGARTTFRILAGFSLTTCVLYSLFLYWRYSLSVKDNDIRRKDPEEMEKMREIEV